LLQLFSHSETEKKPSPIPSENWERFFFTKVREERAGRRRRGRRRCRRFFFFSRSLALSLPLRRSLGRELRRNRSSFARSRSRSRFAARSEEGSERRRRGRRHSLLARTFAARSKRGFLSSPRESNVMLSASSLARALAVARRSLDRGFCFRGRKRRSTSTLTVAGAPSSSKKRSQCFLFFKLTENHRVLPDHPDGE